jgi:ComF family protein
MALSSSVMMNLKYSWRDFIDLVFPRCCEACNRPLFGSEHVICTICHVDLPRISSDSHLLSLFENKFPDNDAIQNLYSFLVFTKKGKVQNLLHSLKYRGKSEVGVVLGKMFGSELLQNEALPPVDLLISVPLHARKKKERGYNQSEAFARGISESTQIPFSDELLERIRYTKSQTGKTKLERRENVRGIFKVIDPDKIKGKSIGLVDDVLTTGATLESCVATLMENGCKECYIMTLAAAQG